MARTFIGAIAIGVALALLPATVSAAPITRSLASGSRHPVCMRAGKTIQLSSGALMYCFGPAFSGATPYFGRRLPLAIGVPPNVDAAAFAEDISPAGVRAYGQSETSIAAVDNYAVEAWNDSTGFISPCPSPNNKEELTGFAFSSNGGASFTDFGGPPNANCMNFRMFGDPSVVAYKNATGDFFYISSLYFGFGTTPSTAINYLALTPCRVITSPAPGLHCGQPVKIAQSTECVTTTTGLTFCSFLDKEFMTVDPFGRLYVSYSDFSVTDGDSIDIAVCDIGTAAGGPGQAGGTADQPVCPQGKQVSNYPAKPAPKPFLVLSAPTPCEVEGAYPDIDTDAHNVYVAWEFNWFTNYHSAQCAAISTTETLAMISQSKCLTLALVSPCSGPQGRTSIPIVSMITASIPGYNRFPMNDFPRIAVSEPFHTVSLVWNDTRDNPNGDIDLQSFRLNTLTPVQTRPVKLNTTPFAEYAFLPALRNANSAGNLNVSWYDRRLATESAGTDVFVAREVSPLTTTAPLNERVTNVTSNWLNNNSFITPNFGDYTDNFVTFMRSRTISGHKLYIAWSDGRYSVPQPFEANFP